MSVLAVIEAKVAELKAKHEQLTAFIGTTRANIAKLEADLKSAETDAVHLWGGITAYASSLELIKQESTPAAESQPPSSAAGVAQLDAYVAQVEAPVAQVEAPVAQVASSTQAVEG